MPNQGLSPPAYQQIRKGNNHATEDAIRLVFDALVQEISQRTKGQSKATDRFDKKVLEHSPSAQMDNLDYQAVGTINFAGASAQNLTGIIAPEKDGAMIILHTTGAGTITVKHQSANSDAGNRIVTSSAGDRNLATGNTLIIQYLSGRWRELSYQ
jgi:hypothetical protein